MKVDFEAAIRKSWNYSKNKERLGLLSILYLVALSIVLVPVFLIYKSLSPAAFSIASLIGVFGWLFLGILIAILIVIFSMLMFMHNYANQKSIRNSARFARSYFLRFLLATVIVAVISIIVSIVPVIGIVFSIIVGLIFFFVHQEIAVSRSGISDALHNSYDLFMKNKLNVVITLVVSAVLELIIILIFAIPLIVAAFSTLFSAVRTGHILQTFLSNMPIFVATGLILVVGVAFGTLFATAIKTDVYMQLKKRKR